VGDKWRLQESQEKSKSKIMSDTEYNLHKQLAEELAFLWHVDGYIRDAEKDGNQQAVEAFKRIKEDEERHAQLLKGLLQQKGQAATA
jgi:rubrerythrin